MASEIVARIFVALLGKLLPIAVAVRGVSGIGRELRQLVRGMPGKRKKIV